MAISMDQEDSPFQRKYAARVNTFGFIFLALHFPVLCLLAAFLGVSVWLAAGISLLLLLGPGMILLQDRSLTLGSIVIGAAAMGFSSLVIHIAGGRIEAHFHIFTVLALLIVLAALGLS